MQNNILSLGVIFFKLKSNTMLSNFVNLKLTSESLLYIITTCVEKEQKGAQDATQKIN